MTEHYSKGLSRKKFLLLLEEVFTVVTLMFYSGAFIAILSGSITSDCDTTALQQDSDTAIVKLIFTLTYAVFLGLLMLRWKRVMSMIGKNLSIIILLGLALLSCLWSEDFSISLNRGIALFGTTLFGLYLGTRYPLQRQLQLLGWAFGLAGILSMVFAVGLPSIGTMCSHEGAWRGIYSHKNTLGKVMALSTITFLILLNSEGQKILPWLGLSGSVTLILFSTSKSSLVIAIVLLMLFPIYQSLRLRQDILAPVVLTTIVLIFGSFILLLSNADSILLSLGRDATLTGRTELWERSLEMIKQRFFLGYGYHSFWEGWDSPGGYVWQAVGWKPPSAHNGLLDLALDLGILGVVIFLAGFMVNLVRSFFWVRLSKDATGLLPLIYLSFLFLANITESTLLERNNIFWVLYVAISLSTLTPLKGSDLEIKDKSDEVSFNSNQNNLTANLIEK